MTRTEWKPGVEHPAINGTHNNGQLAAVNTPAGTVPCRPGDFIVEDDAGVHVERADGSLVVLMP